MKTSPKITRVAFISILAIGITLSQFYLAFGAGRSSGRGFKGSRSARFGASSVSLSGARSATFSSGVRFTHPRTEGQGFLSTTQGFLSRTDRQRFDGQRFFSDRFGFPFGFGGTTVIDGFDDGSIIVFVQTAPAPDLNKPSGKRVYVQPRWVDAGHGVEILEPGRWTVQP
jgi:hypothetical protein